MDGEDRRRSQYGQPYQTPRQSRPTTAQPMGPPSSDRYSHPSTTGRIDNSRSSLAPSYLPTGYASFGYHEQQYASSQMQSSSPIHGVELQYTPEYVHGRQQQTPPGQSQQQFGTYAPSVLPPVTPQNLYETLPQYQQRQSGGIDVMTDGFPVASYMHHNEPSNVGVGVGVGGAASQYLTSQPEQSNLGSMTLHRPSLQQNFGTGAVDYPLLEHQETQDSQTSNEARPSLVDGLRDYEQQLKVTFEAVIAGRLTEASNKLLELSRWLLSSVVHLGLHHDDEKRHSERLFLWQQFNLCWEALGQKQKDVTEEALRTRRPPVDILSVENVQGLIHELLALCDAIEPYGLVDYEMGVWEEQITEIFSVCTDLLRRHNSRSEVTPPRTG